MGGGQRSGSMRVQRACVRGGYERGSESHACVGGHTVHCADAVLSGADAVMSGADAVMSGADAVSRQERLAGNLNGACIVSREARKSEHERCSDSQHRAEGGHT
eukprot:273828-Chlamydomonas_euryale.AAC.4